MPVYNSDRYLQKSIESILSQSLTNFEFIIVDDGSSDNSLKIIKKYIKKDKRIVLIQNPVNIGTTKSLNKGLFIAKGKYIVRMDADDWSYPDRFKKQYEYMEKNIEIGVSGGVVDVCNEDMKIMYTRKYPLTNNDIRKIIFLYSPFAHSATIWNTEKMKNVGGYNENILLSQDCELYFKIGKDSKFGNITSNVIKLRTHNKSSSVSRDMLQDKYAIYARIKAVMEYNYNLRFIDKFYIFIRILAMILMTTQSKFWLFNQLRRKI